MTRPNKLLSPSDALAVMRELSSVESIGGAELPLVAIDLRSLPRSFRQHDQDEELVSLLAASPWVNVAVVDDDLDPDFARLADHFDVLFGDGTDSAAAVDCVDVEAQLAELRVSVAASPLASVALARLLRTTHDLPIAQALHMESLTYAMLQTGTTYQRWLAERTPKPVDQNQAVRLERTASLLNITLQRPERRNALNITMRDELAEAFALIDADPSIDGAILRGDGSNFCAGGDLDEFGSTPSPATGHQVRMLRSLPSLLHRVRDRVRVHAHGSCVGAGIELSAFAATIIAHPDATFRLPEIGFGLVPGAGGTVSVTRRCGRHRAAWLALTGTTIDASLALRWQLIDRIDESVF